MEGISTPKHSTLALKVQVTKKKQNENLTRPLWSNKVEYILIQVACSMRLSTLWSFPHLWLLNGGIFLIIYILMLLLIGVPLLFMEMASGQRLHQSSLGVWKLTSPWMTGLGYTSFMVCFIEGLLLNVINCWSIFYLSQSFQFPLPWDKCPLVKNASEFDAECARTTPSMYFWYRQTLKASDTIEDYGPVIPSISLSSFLTWCLTGVIMINGLKSIGKAVYVFILLPCFISLCFLIRCLLLEGTSFGLQHLFVSKISNVFSVKIWNLAGNQVLSALGLGFGIIAAFSSYISPSNNCLIDAFVVALVNLGTSLLFTPIITSVLGFWATVTTSRCSEKNVEILTNLVFLGELPPEAKPPENVLANATSMFTTWLNSLPHSVKKMVLSKVSDCNIQDQLLQVKEGSSFVFLAFIEAMSFIPGSAFWSILFFLTFLTLGLSAVIGVMQGIITPLQDSFSFFRKHPKLLIVNVSVLMFLCSLFFARPSGYYFFRLLSDYWIIPPIVLLTTFENVTIAWVYGAKRFVAEMMILMGRPISPICCFLLCCLCPFVLLALSVITLIYIYVQDFIYLAWDSSTSKVVPREFPSWARSLIIILDVIVFLPILIYFLHCLIRKIPISNITFNMPVIASKSLTLRSHLRSNKDLPNEEILQDDKKIADQPVV
ncbi:orphan sodium- and chloride-dependent neurotransmitter transporter NTT5 [Trichechus manatus latirostris]|uniref:Orphan sodium- and chloride-dependent neurotransmitter transporter NTT5 n=1 Tax=Trichechus manatus latirostris TaxID=127582 RepID=A0A2Y9DV71_TRIMA|nr:orphan sodium- and chloride-dependent neurotransmitter transporter NTT5 [Trichechus manatus latirostris]